MSDTDDIFGKDDSDVEAKAPAAVSEKVNEPAKSALLSDIFGDSDEEDAPQVRQLPRKPADYEEDDNLLADSDEEESNNRGRLQKNSSSKPSRPADDNLIDSDDEDVLKAVQMAKKRKHSEKERKDKKDKKKKKKKMILPMSRNSQRPGEDEEQQKEVSSGDEYDSGEEAVENEDDRRFIAKDDEFADLVKEYDEDNQHFDDERPSDDEEGYSSSKKHKKSSGSRSESFTVNAKDMDPLSVTLREMKNPKAKQLSDIQKEQYVDKLQKKMQAAVLLDDQCFAKREPAIHKLKLLPVVVQALNMKGLQNTLLERDILCDLRDWIEPRDAKTLSALAIRTAIYEILLKMSVTPDYLKRTVGDKPPIGATIVQLRKHKMETPENKRMLKEIMDKWSRPIFSKSMDVRGNGGVLMENPEVHEAMRQRYSQSAAAASEGQSSQGGRGAGGEDEDVKNEQMSQAQSQQVQLDSVLSGKATQAKSTDLFNRARTPYSTGFLFTVQPELKSVDKTDIMEKTLGKAVRWRSIYCNSLLL